MTFLDLFRRGGILMYPIFFCSIFALGIFIERMLYLLKSRVNKDRLMFQIRSSLKKNRPEEALTICNSIPGPITRVLKVGLLKRSKNPDEIQKAIDEAALYEIPRLEKFVPWLGIVASIAPLLGLTGTVIGMIRAFNVIAKLSLGNPQALAGGISEALITTAAGLIVGIPALIAYEYINMKVGNIIADIEGSSTELINLFIERR